MNPIPDGRSLELYFIDGRPDGMLTAEVFNWTGHVLMTPRTRIGAALARKEANYTGVYLLLGELEGEPRAYIGEAEDISYRIRTHDTKKDWWTSAVLVTTSANNLNKAHGKYLEARLVEEARLAARTALDNVTTPSRPGLSEAARSNMEAFLAYLLMVLPALRVDLFIRNTRASTPVVAGAVPLSKGEAVRFQLSSKKHGLTASAMLQDGEFIVEAASMARRQWESPTTANTAYAQLHATLLKNGVLRENGSHCVFTANCAFASTSAAAAVVLGRPSNGTLEWHRADGSGTYKQWEAAQLAGASP
jgi:hypothetical protein